MKILSIIGLYEGRTDWLEFVLNIGKKGWRLENLTKESGHSHIQKEYRSTVSQGSPMRWRMWEHE